MPGRALIASTQVEYSLLNRGIEHEVLGAVDHVRTQLVLPVDPVEPASRGLRIAVVAGRLTELEQAHRGHRVLVHGVDLVALHDRALLRVEDPRPAAVGQLQCEQAVGRRAGRGQRALVEPGTGATTETGEASWYDPPWSGLTAAHPWLPFGTLVTVSDRHTGRSVTVVIDDRGPFGPGRIIDLSPEAFAQLSPLGRGVLDVELDW